MAKCLWLSVAVALAVASTSAALKCFHCNDCGEDDGTPYDCSSKYDRCMKINLAGRVQKSCSVAAACGLGAVERGVVKAWNNLKNLISDVDQDTVDFSQTSDAQLIYCCDTNYCNSSCSKAVSPLALLIPLLLRLLLQA